MEEIRKLFPYLKTGLIYFNHSSVGALPVPVVERINKHLAERSEGEIANFETMMLYNTRGKEKIAKLINARPERVSWCENVSHAISILAQGLEWKAGDRIILNDIEFPSNVYPFMALKEYGVEIDFAKSHNGIVDLEDIEKLITPRTKLISISMVQFLSGYRADVNAIGSLCKSKGIIFCVDIIQAAGAVQIDVDKIQADFLTGGTHKWLLGMQGLGYFYLTEELQSKIKTKIVGWTSVVNSWDILNYDLTLLETADRFQSGTFNDIGMAAIDASLDIFFQYGMDNVERNILNNTKYFMQKLNGAGINTLLNNVGIKNLAGIVTIKIENAKRVFLLLESRNMKCSLREGYVRFSPHFYNTKEEIDKVVENIVSLRRKGESS
jgi:selenocysteine lyase/cysteine desulfurase